MYHARFNVTATDTLFAELLDRHRTPLRAHARRLTGNSIDAVDLVQDTMLRCWSARNSFEPGSNFGAWSRVVMRNSFLSTHRRDRFHASLPEEAFDRMPGVEGGQDQAVELRDIGWALGKLSSDQRDAVVLAGNGVSIEDAARELAIPEGTFKSRVARGRVRLRQLIEDPAAKSLSPMVRKDKPWERRNWEGVLIGRL
ncbi:RNA polymerase sigma factor [Sphingomonas glacialis]|uniref:Sigma-70 family RNA polymerase sigma factor n=1 Tax=Sphingomonas glacialis TaxID=658225 RepID=A0A502FB78_9SPHN|nr:sigma-70 family RNA polymerase sigma factor [Sphingomonas glacialis]TPG46553.1 sigma-70 family RNA polymerase sigma factor [Sphingomonas glacialis]